MPSAYPGALDTLATNKADGTATATDHAAHHNALAEAILAVQGELGLNPSETFATLKDRLNARDYKRSCRMATVEGNNISGTYTAGPPATIAAGGTSLTIDGVAAVNGDRVFLKNQTNRAHNGIYAVSGVGSAVVLTRAYDADAAASLSDSMFVSVEQGTVNADTQWELLSNNPITVGTTSLDFTRVQPAYIRVSSPINSREYSRTGVKLESFDPYFVQSTNNGTILTSGTVRVNPLGVARAGDTLNGISFLSGTTAGASITNSWAGIARVRDRVIVAISPTNSTASWTANSFRDFTFSAAWTAPEDTALFAFLMVAGTTMPSMVGIGMANAAIAGSPLYMGNSNTGQTTPLANGATLATITAPTNYANLYCKVT